MKKIIISIIFILFISCTFYAQNDKKDKNAKNANNEEINLGRIYFPKAFVHAKKDYKRGVYRVKFTKKDEIPYFIIMNKKKEPLFEEMAIVKPYEGKYKKFRYRLKREMLKGYEYFRIKLTRPDNFYMAYFLIKNKDKRKEEKKIDETKPEKKETKQLIN